MVLSLLSGNTRFILSWQAVFPFSKNLDFPQELEKKRKERAQVAYERKKQLNKLRVKAEKVAEEKLGPQLDVLAPVKY